ncbi:uncharacterized protein [Dermacentor andersoni]|uniref:uncharacterized protein isoform X1 n=1 Tax=Dermacentor andersoni TaxID=34620 RepID=UPI002155B643|nr:transcriptional regulator ATRX-like isoform X1 [Dermacentor andersoni]
MAHREASSSKQSDEDSGAPAKTDTLVLLWMSSENNAVRRPPLNNEEIANLCVICTSCGSQVNHHDKSKVRFHRVLNVLVCKRCYSYYGDGQFKKDDSGTDEYCSWCAEGGNLIVCDSCTRAFCKNCIHRNLSRREVTRVGLLKEWHCYVCDPAPLVPMVNYAKLIGNYSRQLADSTSAGTSDSSGPMKLSEVELRKLALQKTFELQQSLSELAAGGQEELLANMSKLLRNHSRCLSRIAQSAEECQKRKMKSRRKKPEQKGAREECRESSASVDCLPADAKKQTKNKRLLVPNEDCGHFNSPDKDLKTKHEEHSKEGNILDAKSDTHSAIVNSMPERLSASVTEAAADSSRGEQDKNITGLDSKSQPVYAEKQWDVEKPIVLEECNSPIDSCDDGQMMKKREGRTKNRQHKQNEKRSESDSTSGTSYSKMNRATEELGAPPNIVGGAISVDEAENDVSSSTKKVTDYVAKECLAQMPENKKEDAAPLPIDIPPVLSLGDEFSPVILNGESENESESLLADLFGKRKNDMDKSEIIPETPPKNEQEEKAGDKQVQQDSGDQLTDARRRESVSTVDMSPSSEDCLETAVNKVARKFGKNAGKANSSADSVDEDNRMTESFSSSEEGKNKRHLTPQKTVLQQKKRTPLSKDMKARRALIRSLNYTSQSSSDGENDPSASTPHAQKHRSPKKRKRVSSGSVAQLSEPADKCLEKAFEEYSDPKLEMTPSVELQRLNIDPSIIAAAKMEIEGSMGDDEKAIMDNEDKEIARLLAPIRMTRKAPSNEASEGEKEAPACDVKVLEVEAEAKKQKGPKKQKKAASSKSLVLDDSSDDSDDEDDAEVECGSTKEVPGASFMMSENSVQKDSFQESLLQDILHSSSEESSEDNTVEPEKHKKKRKKVEAKAAEPEDVKATEVPAEETTVKECEKEEEGRAGSSCEEVVKKKAGKYDKLLRKNVLAGLDDPISEKEVSKESDKEEPATKPQKGKASKKRKIVYSDDEDDCANKQPSTSSLSSSEESASDSSDDFTPSRKKKGKNTKKTKASVDDSDFAESKSKKGASSSSDVNKRKKKRKRIRVACSTADENDDDDSCVEILPGSSQDADGKSRKNIRKLISDKKLTQETKAAALAEEERKKRIADRQKLYNETFGTVPSDADTKVKQLVLEVDLKTKETLVEVDKSLVTSMKPHQVKGVKFMYDCVIESLEMLKKDPVKGSGCILAHCMGLGKTFQVISFLHTVMTHKVSGPLLRTALVVCPYNTVLNWANEFERWLDENNLDLKIYETSAIKVNTVRLEVLERWHRKGGVAIVGYDMFRRLVNARGKGRKLQERLRKVLLDPGPSMVVCDEGHVLKNDTTGLSKAMSELRTGRRIVLTGTPLQNNLQEYHCMVSFVKPGLLGTKNEFRNRFVNPIANGACADSTVHDVKLMKKRVHILHRLLDGCVQRCDYGALAPFLPPKCEYVISVRLSEVQVALYRHFLEHLARGRRQQAGVGTSLFWDFNMLRNIWTHPMLLELSAERLAAKELLKEEDDESDMASFIDDGSLSEKSTPDTNDDADAVICLDDDGPKTRSQKRGREKNKDAKDDASSGDEVISSWQTRSRGNPDERPPTPPRPEKKQWWDQYISEEDMEKLQISGKMSLLYNILQECDAIGDKVLLFSQSLLTLDMVERLLDHCDERAAAVDPETALVDPADPLRDCHNTWVRGIDYFRMDGSTSVDMRARWIEMFNDEDNPRGRLFLISTKAGSLGTNLVGANRVVLMDASWNPTHDVQAIFRVYRFGQKKPVFIYRMLAQGTMEEKIYDRQVTKQSLSCRVVDEQQIERHFNAADLQELYSFSPDSKSNRPTPMVPKDRLLAELLIRNKDWIVSYHEHDSLLQNITSEELTEEERKLAWEEYKDEREGRINIDLDTLPTGIPSEGSGQSFRLTLDLHKMIAEIKVKYPYLTPNQLVDQLRRVLLAYKQEFQKRQMSAFEKRTTFLKFKQPIPNEIITQLTESGMAIQQLNQVLTKLQGLGVQAQQQTQPQQQQQQQQQQQYYQQQAYMRQQAYQQAQARPQFAQQQAQYQFQRPQATQHVRPGMSQAEQIYASAYNYCMARGVNPQMARNYAINQQRVAFQQLLMQQQMGSNPTSGRVVVSEAEDDSHAAGSSSSSTRQPSTSSVVITEIID